MDGLEGWERYEGWNVPLSLSLFLLPISLSHIDPDKYWKPVQEKRGGTGGEGRGGVW